MTTQTSRTVHRSHEADSQSHWRCHKLPRRAGWQGPVVGLDLLEIVGIPQPAPAPHATEERRALLQQLVDLRHAESIRPRQCKRGSGRANRLTVGPRGCCSRRPFLRALPAAGEALAFWIVLRRGAGLDVRAMVEIRVRFSSLDYGCVDSLRVRGGSFCCTQCFSTSSTSPGRHLLATPCGQ